MPEITDTLYDHVLMGFSLQSYVDRLYPHTLQQMVYKEAVECGKSMPSLCHKRRGHVDLMFFTLCAFQIVGMMADVCHNSTTLSGWTVYMFVVLTRAYVYMHASLSIAVHIGLLG